VKLAIEVFTKHRLKLISESRFIPLENLLNLFPEAIFEKYVDLKVTRGWILLHKGNIPEMAKFIDPLEQTINDNRYTQEYTDLLVGELHTMKTFDRYLANVDLEACLEHSKQAIKLLKDKNPYASGIAWVYYGASMQHLGYSSEAKEDIYKALENAEAPILRGHLLLILGFLDWFDGDLGGLIKTAEHILQLGYKTGIKMLVANGNIFKGIVHYYQNNDDLAMKYLLEAHEFRRYTYLHLSFGTGMALADIYTKTGKQLEKEAIMHAYEKIALNQGGKLFNNITLSASADLAWRYQQELVGLKWAKENDYKDFLPISSLFSPELVQALILTLDDDNDSHMLAQEVLNVAISFFEPRNDKNVLIRALVMQSVLYYKLGDSEKAYDTLDRVLAMSSIGRYIRPYIELGEPMKLMLQKCKKTNKNKMHIDDILHNFIVEAKINEKVVLTIREKEILEIAGSMTNKEVGNQLFISEQTVKTHMHNIIKKLNVNSKVDAVVKAREMELL
jgi:ATP/maltotriose-dependent transcriptional regulator MalT